uniref:Ceramide synthase 2a n=1 Tax=Lates calcarifer TaxID=8187 RepID=A0A4W6F970_LATCA
MSRLSELIWADWIWFPEGHGWADLKDHDDKVFPKTWDLWATIPIALCFLVIRQIFERTVAIPLASLLGVSDKQRVCAPPNPTLESYFCSTSKHPTQVLNLLSKQTGCSVRQVQRWFRRRRNQDRPSKLKKFREARYCSVGNNVSFSFSQPLLPSQYWYYVIELGFYVSLLFSVASDVKRKDFKEQIVHHVATILLISFSWLVNYIRAGTLIMLVHDASDYLMEVMTTSLSSPVQLTVCPLEEDTCKRSHSLFIPVSQNVQLRRLEENLQLHLHCVCCCFHHHPTRYPALLVKKSDLLSLILLTDDLTDSRISEQP